MEVNPTFKTLYAHYYYGGEIGSRNVYHTFEQSDGCDVDCHEPRPVLKDGHYRCPDCDEIWPLIDNGQAALEASLR